MDRKVLELKPTVIHENERDDIAEHEDIMDLTIEDIREINKEIKAMYENEV